MLTILIRTSYRPKLFKRLIASIPEWCKTIVSYDDDRALEYIGDLQKVRVYKHGAVHWYDDYVNTLKDLVTDGYFMVVDDDDKILPGSLDQIKNFLLGPGLICQFSRGGKLKPSYLQIARKEIRINKIGMPCLILHHSNKNIASLDGSKYAADYTWIKEVADKVDLSFVPIAVVYADRRSKGKLEGKD